MARPSRSVPAGGVGIVALAAALWGTDALFRRGLALEAPATSVVLWEHVLLAVLTAPLVWRRRAELAALDARGWGAVLLVGAGASAAATVAFTAALGSGDPTTPLLLQKTQPLVAVALAVVVLRERPRVRLAGALVPALVGVYLITFADPTAVSVTAAASAGLALLAAALWAGGTVLGRLLSSSLSFTTLTGMRFAVGLPAAAVLAATVGEGLTAPAGDQLPGLVGLSLVPGLLALGLYYRGLRATPASLATIAELAFPLAAILVNRVAFGATLTPTQWLGVALLSGTVVWVSLAGRRGSAVAGVEVTADAAVPAVTS